ncbi:Putative archaeal/bacterial/fungal rhodopsin, rhodopsin, retinal binding, yro2-like, 7TM [Septoria linicola]|uniref:Archaeal/bacterial/fungal rhodopsin, rhodopsin, retinal binding, yro2-like, 7TM n=1 Tax=Septoria linicola TaxID=215465 RepID=A0A9Q9EGG3_9PEZI|nr:putative archaeal/bacterial/fungal rhodopsin, rhodopsin, retinal binding, yro2-like, 7TM [Septoria linicola]USW50791.1 Putative archaeal/bacterial/fungal rhodopsin, rhodopsin, retinal binding, yro2-like, 7TM [Septoria linicola]
MVNNAVSVNNGEVNTGSAQIAITSHGSDFYFAICAVMTVSTFAFLGLGMTKPRHDRIFHYITASVTMVAAIAYFTMGSHLGFVPIDVEYQRSDPRVAGVNREIYYARYIDWVITTPLLLTDLMLTAAMPWPTIMFVILVDEVMIITGLIGALVFSSYKWGYFVFGCVALVYIVYVLVWEARIHAKNISSEAGKAFLYCGSLTAFLWIMYPIAWGVSEGGNIIAPDSEAVFYGILDFLAKPVFGALLIWGHRNITPAQLGLTIHDYGGDDPVIHEKKTGISAGHTGHPGDNPAHNGTANGGTNGVTNGNAV